MPFNKVDQERGYWSPVLFFPSYEGNCQFSYPCIPFSDGINSSSPPNNMQIMQFFLKKDLETI